MLMITGRFAIDPAERDPFLEFARALIPVERNVSGCISFDIFEDVLTPNTFLLVEQWEDESALDAYTETDAYAEHDDALNGYMVGEPVWEEYQF